MKTAPTVENIAGIIEGFAPKSLALPHDPVGLQCGDPGREVRKMMISLDASLETLRQAAEGKVDLLVTHHPLLFQPIDLSSIASSAGRALTRAIQENIAVYSAHTNLDASPRGMNVFFADLLDIRDRKFLQEQESDSFKVVVFVPRENLEGVRSAAFAAGGGRIGGYSGCSFTVEGEGTFHPGEDTSPVIGRAGCDEKVREVRLEVSVPSQGLGAVLTAIHKVHPYEEPAVDVYPTLAGTREAGMGITGVLPRRMTVGQVADRIGSLLNTRSLRLVGKKGSRVRAVAVCAGSGATLLDEAVKSGAQLFITGDMKYHDARKAEDAGIHVLDTGHFAPERYGLLRFGKLLEGAFARQGFQVRLLFAKEKDPFTPV